jgi:uncharacterized protein YbjT (DUF2867 family)
MNPDGLILVTGANGYIGGCLVPRLLDKGYRVRCLTRNPALLENRSWYAQVEILQGDIIANETVDKALEGVTASYYLIHNMASGYQYPERDFISATNFGSSAGKSGLQHIIYLGGLADSTAEVSRHMRSRLQTGDVLRKCGVPVTEFQASMIIGAGSISFEMIRFLTEQIPILIGPRWFQNYAQPIAIENVLDYLLAALETPGCKNRVFEIGGKDIITYAEAMLIYARLRGLKRRMVILPITPLKLMAFGVDKLTPVRANIARPLIDGMRSNSIVRNDAASQVFPQIKPIDYQMAISTALSKYSPANIELVWENRADSVKITKHAGFLIDSRHVCVDASPECIFDVLTNLGGKSGWLYLNSLWQLRGLLDRLIGGPGMRGRQASKLKEGETVDFYCVEALNPGRLFRLQAEVRAPGTGWMEWRVKPQAGGNSALSQIAYFAPKGVFGFLYWYILFPVHGLVLAGLIKGIAYRAIEHQRLSPG